MHLQGNLEERRDTADPQSNVFGSLLTTFGSVEVGGRNFFKLMQNGECVLLYPGGVREVCTLIHPPSLCLQNIFPLLTSRAQANWCSQAPGCIGRYASHTATQCCCTDSISCKLSAQSFVNRSISFVPQGQRLQSVTDRVAQHTVASRPEEEQEQEVYKLWSANKIDHFVPIRANMSHVYEIVTAVMFDGR